MRFLLALVGIAAAVNVKLTPMAQVIQMLKDMKIKGAKEIKNEQRIFAQYKQWCTDVLGSKAEEIQDSKMAIETAEAQISETAAISEQMGVEIAGHKDDIATWKSDMESATSVRELENQRYQKMHQDYTESIEALQAAIKILKKQDYSRAQVSVVAEVQALIQSLPPVSLTVKQIVDNFLQQREEPLVDGVRPRTVADDRKDQAQLRKENEEASGKSGEAYGYEFQSGKVITMLEELFKEFVDERRKLEDKETQQAASYKMMMDDLTQNSYYADGDRREKNGRQNEANQKNAQAKGDLNDASSTLKINSKFVEDTTADCKLRKDQFGSRSKARCTILLLLLISGIFVSRIHSQDDNISAIFV